MKIGIISDSHDQVDNIKKAVSIFKKEKVNLVYHAGDLCSPFVLHLFQDLKVKLVFGNNDADVFKHLKFKQDNLKFYDKFFVDEVEGKKICLIHGDPEELVNSIFESKRYDVIFRGHNHVAEIKKNDKTIMINPGNLVGPFSDKTTFWTKPSIALYDMEKNTAKIVKI